MSHVHNDDALAVASDIADGLASLAAVLATGLGNGSPIVEALNRLGAGEKRTLATVPSRLLAAELRSRGYWCYGDNDCCNEGKQI